MTRAQRHARELRSPRCEDHPDRVESLATDLQRRSKRIDTFLSVTQRNQFEQLRVPLGSDCHRFDLQVEILIVLDTNIIKKNELAALPGTASVPGRNFFEQKSRSSARLLEHAELLVKAKPGSCGTSAENKRGGAQTVDSAPGNELTIFSAPVDSRIN